MENIKVREHIAAQLKVLKEQKALLRQEEAILKKALADLSSLERHKNRKRSKSAQVAETTGETEARTSENPFVKDSDHRDKIIGLLEERGGPLRTSEIARLAFERKLIESESGQRGVSNIVNTVLYRNKKHTFIKLSYGLWDLRKRHRVGAGLGLDVKAVGAAE